MPTGWASSHYCACVFLRTAFAHPSSCEGSNGKALLQKARTLEQTRISKDGVIAESGSPYDFYLEAEPNHTTWVFMHIAKSGGSSWVQNMQKDVLPGFLEGDGFLSQENCSHNLAQAVEGKRANFTVMLREPRAHIYSLYMMSCCTMFGQTFGFKVAEDVAEREPQPPLLRNVTAWLSWFSQTNVTEDFGTVYHPLNFQARHFTCLGEDPHHVELPEPTMDSIFAQFNSDYGFVGILERYQESMCLFVHMATGKLPAYCDCDDPESWDAFPERHEEYDSPPHDIADLTSDDIRMIDALTQQDTALYAEGVRRFIRKIDDAEQNHGVHILCDREIIKQPL